MPSSTTSSAAALQQDADAAAAAAAAQRVLASKHAKLLLTNPSEELLADLSKQIQSRTTGQSRLRLVASWASRLLLLLALCNVCSVLLFSRYPALWQLLQNTEAFSRVEMEYNRLVRRVTVGLGLHNYELLHARERQQCLLPNPLYRPKLRCCPCNKHRVVTVGSATVIRSGFDRLFDHMVGPFAYGNNSQPAVTFPELRAAVTGNWEAVSTGSNRLHFLWPPVVATPESPASLEGLFGDGANEAPPAGRAVSWLFGHLPAIRALRRLVRRADHVPELAEDVLARQFVFLGDGVPAGEPIGLSDMDVVKGLAYAYSLYGQVTISLALKPECCPREVSSPDYRNETKRLGPGEVLGFLTNCYWLSLAKLETSGYAMVYFGSVYNGLHPTETTASKKTAQ